MQSGMCSIMAQGCSALRLNEGCLCAALGCFQQTKSIYNLCVAIEGSEVQRRSSVFVCVVDDRTFLHQKLYHVLMSF